MNYTLLNPVRNLMRKIGLTKLLTYPKRIKAASQIKEYNKSKPEYIKLSLGSHEIDVYTSDSFEWMRAKSFYEDKHIISAITKFLKKGDTYWDVGASIGLYSNYIAQIVGNEGTVIAFEPETRSLKLLRSNITLNKSDGIIKSYQVALGNKKETLFLQLAERPSAGNHQLTSTEVNGTNVQEVEVIPADQFLKREGLRIPNAIKIDVEGFEEKVIKGASEILSNDQCRMVLIEVHFSILASQGDHLAHKRIKDILHNHSFINFNWLDPSHLLASK